MIYWPDDNVAKATHKLITEAAHSIKVCSKIMYTSDDVKHRQTILIGQPLLYNTHRCN